MKYLVTRIPYSIWAGICNSKIGRGAIEYTNAMQGHAYVSCYLRGYTPNGAVVQSKEVKAKVFKLDPKDNPYDAETKTIRIRVEEKYGLLANILNDENTYDGILVDDERGMINMTKFNAFSWMTTEELTKVQEQLNEAIEAKGCTIPKVEAKLDIESRPVAKLENKVEAKLETKVEAKPWLAQGLTMQERVALIKNTQENKEFTERMKARVEAAEKAKVIKPLKEAALEPDDEDDEGCPFDADDNVKHDDMSNFSISSTTDADDDMFDEKDKHTEKDTAKLEELHEKIEKLRERMHLRDELLKLASDNDEVIMLKRANTKDNHDYWELSEEYSRISK